jgi:DNA-binding transcriptional MerR regulator
MSNNISEYNSTAVYPKQEKVSLPKWEDLPELDLYMDQVITLMNKYIGGLSADSEITPSMINNYVKQGIIPCPVKKKYSKVHLSRLIIICTMKSVLPIQSIGALIDILLRTRSEEELLNFFTEHYEQTLSKITDFLNSSHDNIISSDSDPESTLSIAVMRAAAVSEEKSTE